MNGIHSDDGTELRISPKPVLAALATLGALSYLALQMLGYRWQMVSQAIWLFVLLSALAIIGWLLSDWRSAVGRWFTMMALVAAFHLAGLWLEVPGALAWAVVPTALAVPLVGTPAATLVPVLESIIVLGLARFPAAGLDQPDAAAILVAIWGVFGASYAAYGAIHRRSMWLAKYFEQAQQALEETRDHRAEQERALRDVATANRQLALMNERVSTLRVIAEEAQKAKTRFVARVSHEFRTPLNMIIGMVELMAERPEIYDVALSPRMQEALQVVHRNSQHLSEMVNDVLDLTRVETDRMVLHRERVNVREVIESAAEAVQPLIDSKKLVLQIVASEDVPSVYCDRTRIEQVVLNLLSNAARYTDEGGVTVTLSRHDQRVLASVADTGPGIPQQDLEMIFEPFCQGTSDTWRDKGGSGLGLSISRQLVKLHGGQMWVESELGGGTTFSFELPISPPMAPAAKPGHQIQESWIWREQRSRPSFPDSHYNPRFIVCDETGDFCAMLARCTGEIEFVDARGGTEATMAVRQAPAHAVLLNVTALEELQPCIEALRQEATGTPIIGCSVPRSLERARALGLQGQLIKPVTGADLAQALQSLDRPVRRVLVVDDDPDAVELFRQMLRVCDGSLEIATACGGEEALERLRGDPADLMLLDLVMPGVDGWQVLEAMARDDETPSVPTYFVSAQDPWDQPPRSSFLLATTGDGLSLNQLLRCSLALSDLLLRPEDTLDPAPG